MRRRWRLARMQAQRGGGIQLTAWWHLPLVGILVGGPISLTASLFLASYGEQGPYGGFWRLLFAGLAASVPVFAVGGLFFTPIEMWLVRRSNPLGALYAGVVRTGVLGIAGVVGAVAAYYIVVGLLAAAPPPTLFPVLLITYPLIGTLIGLTFTLYDEYLRQLRVSTQLTQEMRIARDIQRGLFPRECPQVEGHTLFARCQPALETGGDFYDFIEFRDGRLGMVIADVSGKGMPAALLMADTRSIWRAEARNGHSPAETLRRANRSLCRDINSNDFVTLLYAVLDPANRQLCLASAGHPLPLLHGDSGLREIEVYGLPLGLHPEATYQEVSVSLQPGDTMLMYTDGIVEAINSSREILGFERLAAFVEREGYRTAKALVEHTIAVAHTFSDRAGQADDITVLVLKAHL